MKAGIYPACALALARAGYGSLADLEGATRNEILAIPGVGVHSLEVIEQLLGRPLLWVQKRPPRQPPPQTPEDLWRQRGLPAEAAITFAQAGMTIERLKAMSREELLFLRGAGPKTLHACELLLGRKMPSRRPGDPVAVFWRSQGVYGKAARALSRAGLTTLDELRSCFREDLLCLRGLGLNTLVRLEALLGKEIPGRNAYWCSRGLSVLLGHALVRARIFTLEDLGRLTREEFLLHPGLGYHALQRCESLLGRRLASERRGGHAG